MPIKIPDSLPARTVLESENIFVMTEERATSQDIRPLRILLLNLMPTKIVTETQLMRSLSNTPLQIEIDLLQTSSYMPKHTSMQHLISFYHTFDEIKSKKYDGMIITGAPIENMEFEDVGYWDELCKIMEWAKTNVYSSFHICWGAQAGLYYHYGIPKYPLEKKLFGVFPHTPCRTNCPLLRGFDDVFYAPHSRHSEIHIEDVLRKPELELLSVSEDAGAYIIASRDGRQIFITGNPEYDPDTLASEYFRDLGKGLPIEVPKNYFTDNDPNKRPLDTWRAHAHLLYSNWLNYYVYQNTPFDLDHAPIQ